jgi:hypothetical protein
MKKEKKKIHIQNYLKKKKKKKKSGFEAVFKACYFSIVLHFFLYLFTALRYVVWDLNFKGTLPPPFAAED